MILKILKSPIQNSGPNPHRNFQHSISIRMCLKIRGTNLTFPGANPSRGGQGYTISKNRKSLIKNGGPNSKKKFQHSSSIRKCSKSGGTNSTFGGVNPPQGGRGTRFEKIEKTNTEWWSQAQPTPKKNSAL